MALRSPILQVGCIGTITPVGDPAVDERPRRLAELMARRSGGSVVADTVGAITPLDVILSVHAQDPLAPPLSAHRGWRLVDGTTTEAAIDDAGFGLQFRGEFGEDRLHVLHGSVPPSPGLAPSGYRALAVMTAYNEGDIIEGILDRALDEGFEVHFIDNWSTDGTLEKASDHPAVSTAERFPDRRPEHYEWELLLHRVEQIAENTRADWVVHHDADEWRQSAWPGVPMIDALYWVASAGYNAVDHTVVLHPPTDDRFSPGTDVTVALERFEFGRRIGHFKQVKAWRSGFGPVDLASSGGHEAVFEGRTVFPVNFLLRHYPIRSQSQGMRKIFEERRPRWSPEERRRGWHNQYDDIGQFTNFVRDPDDLPVFEAESFGYRFMFERLARIGIERMAAVPVASVVVGSLPDVALGITALG